MSEIRWMSAAPLWSQIAGNGKTIGVEVTTTAPTLAQPAILRFATDDFMNEFMTVVENRSEHLSEYLARHETWRKPLPQPESIQSLPPVLRALVRRRANSQAATFSSLNTIPDENPLKLFQPAHQRYYLVSASLVCRTPGLPDRTPDSGNSERAAFVVRRLLPKKDKTVTQQATGQEVIATAQETKAPRWGCSSPQEQAQGIPPALAAKASTSGGISTPDGECDEYAFVQGASGPAWQIISDGSQKMDGEELLPLFPVSYTQADGYRRRLFAGLVPAGRREAYIHASEAGQGGATAGQSSQQGKLDPHLDALLASIFTRPWQNLVDTAANVCAKLVYDTNNPVKDDPRTGAEKAGDINSVIWTTRLQIQETSWYLLADLLEFLTDNNLSDVLKAFGSSSVPQPALQTVVTALTNVRLPTATQNALKDAFGLTPAANLGEALVKIQESGQVDRLEQSTQAYDGNGRGTRWPDFIFPLVDVADESGTFTLTVAGASASPGTSTDPAGFRDLAEQYKNWIQDQFHTPVLSVLPPTSKDPQPAVPLAAQVPAKIDDPGWFVIRCVFERPNCLPAPLPLVSDPTQPFQLASFFDSDAPARPIRIALPLDTTPAGLRKFDKNTAFMISDVLCGQIQRAKGLGLGDLVRSVLPWPLHKDLDVPDTGPCKNDKGAAFGMICSLSIPIITICALILLMIIVSLLDIIFRWIPYFILCFPLPKFGGKKGAT